LATLNALSADAERRQWLSWAFEAKLAAIEFIPPSAAARARSSLKTQARQAGFLWVAKRLS
jgi:hypothetical protein